MPETLDAPSAAVAAAMDKHRHQQVSMKPSREAVLLASAASDELAGWTCQAIIRHCRSARDLSRNRRPRPSGSCARPWRHQDQGTIPVTAGIACSSLVKWLTGGGRRRRSSQALVGRWRDALRLRRPVEAHQALGPMVRELSVPPGAAMMEM